jgi:hypothetical protein
MRNVSDKIVQKIKTHVCSVTFFQKCVLYEIMPKNVIEPERPQVTIWRTRADVCRTRQQWFFELASTFCYTFIVRCWTLTPCIQLPTVNVCLFTASALAVSPGTDLRLCLGISLEGHRKVKRKPGRDVIWAQDLRNTKRCHQRDCDIRANAGRYSDNWSVRRHESFVWESGWMRCTLIVRDICLDKTMNYVFWHWGHFRRKAVIIA